MATSLQHTILVISFVVSFHLLWTGVAVMRRASASAFSSSVGLPMASREVQESIALFQPILPNLSFYTFTPANASIQSCVPRLLSDVSCFVPQLLREHMVPGSPTALFQSILTNLDFQKFFKVIPSLSDSTFVVWNGSSTFFAPTDYVFRTSLETMNPGCNNKNKLFVGGIAITDPDFSCIKELQKTQRQCKCSGAGGVLWLTSTGDFSNIPVYDEKQSNRTFVDPERKVENHSATTNTKLGKKLEFNSKFIHDIQRNMPVFDLANESKTAGGYAYIDLNDFRSTDNSVLGSGEATTGDDAAFFAFQIWRFCSSDRLLMDTTLPVELPQVRFLGDNVHDTPFLSIAAQYSIFVVVVLAVVYAEGIDEGVGGKGFTSAIRVNFLKKLQTVLPTMERAQKLFNEMFHRLRTRWFSGTDPADSPF